MPVFEPQDPQFENRVRGSFDRQTVMRTLGAELLRVLPGRVEIGLPYRPELTQQHGFLHAGIVGTVLDSACGYAAYSLMPAHAAVLSIEYKVNLLAPAKGEWFVARAAVKRPGRTVTVTQGDVLAYPTRESDESEGKLVSTMLATMMTVEGREGLVG
jgi:uncharacterized protein (TIGR00369 family)